MHTVSPKALCFDIYTLDLLRCSVFRGSEPIQLRPKSFDVLRYLAENAGRLVSKDELINAVWHGPSVSDDSLVQCVVDIRHALGDDAQRVIKTIPRRGYMLAVEVSVTDSNPRMPATRDEETHTHQRRAIDRVRGLGKLGWAIAGVLILAWALVHWFVSQGGKIGH
jgi:DNA-binding winged helix-turn-helix (wHTH) protein